ncbi:MAG: ABC transporter substrate-binding protein, partial [Planctomycetota bacterium]
MSIVAILLVIQIIDRTRETEQLQAMYQATQRASKDMERQSNELKRLANELASRPAAVVAAPVASSTTTAPLAVPVVPVVDSKRDGKPRLGSNFLKPYDRSTLHPEWIGGTLYDFNVTPKGFNPIVESSADAQAAQDLVNDSLCGTHPASPDRWNEVLATSCVITDDWKTYTFTLRPGVKWGRPSIAKEARFSWLDKDVPLTASDFVFYIEMVKNSDVECPQLRSYYDDLAKAEAPDAHTLVLRWKKKVFTSMSFSMGLSPLPKHIYAYNRDGTPIPSAQLGVVFNKHWFDDLGGIVGVGNYLLESNESDKRVVFRRNPDYWGAGFHFDSIEWIADVKLPDPQLVSFLKGQVQVHGLIPPQYKALILDHKEPRF